MTNSIISLWLVVAMAIGMTGGALPQAYDLQYSISQLPQETLDMTLSDVLDAALAEMPSREAVFSEIPAVLDAAIDEFGLDTTTYSAAVRHGDNIRSYTLGNASLTALDNGAVQFTFASDHLAKSIPALESIAVQADAQNLLFSRGGKVFGVKYAELFDELMDNLPALSASSILSQLADLPFSAYLEDALFLTKMLNLAYAEMEASGFSMYDLHVTGNGYLSITFDTVRLKNTFSRFFVKLFAYETEINRLLDRYGAAFGLPEGYNCAALRTQAMNILRRMQYTLGDAAHINLQIMPTDNAVHVTAQYGERSSGYGATFTLTIADDAAITGSFILMDDSESYAFNVDLAPVTDSLFAGTIEYLYTGYRNETIRYELAVELGVNESYSSPAYHLSVLPVTPITGFSGITANLMIAGNNRWSANVVSDYFTLDASNNYNLFDFSFTFLDELALDVFVDQFYGTLYTASIGWSNDNQGYTYLNWENNTLTVALADQTYTLAFQPEPENPLPAKFAHLASALLENPTSITLASFKQEHNYNYFRSYQTDLTASIFPFYDAHGPQQTLSLALERRPLNASGNYARSLSEIYALDLTRTIAPLRQAPAAFDENSVVWLDLAQLVELIDEAMNPSEATEGEAAQ